MRELSTIQKREKLNVVVATDEKGNGGANHRYEVIAHQPNVNGVVNMAIIQFQDGTRKEEGSTPGVLDTDLLEIVRDRYKAFQDGPFASEYNAKALEHIEIALMYANRRVEDRIERNVLGTNNK
ncbi:ABC transporter ATPase [Clostridium cadaveris]|uniref:ABC transporter ATPase n=1 Tax=Clostridium cadaveris TaxID=1529 RepID=UPI0031D582E9